MKKRILLIFALLCTVAQGAWAETINLSTLTADVTANDGGVVYWDGSDYQNYGADGGTEAATPILTGSNYGVSTTLGGMSDTEDSKDSEDVVDEAW